MGKGRMERVQIGIDSDLNKRVMDLTGEDLLNLIADIAQFAIENGCEDVYEDACEKYNDLLEEIHTMISDKAESDMQVTLFMAMIAHSLMASLVAMSDVAQMYYELEQIERGIE